jgi:hypothetical protein
LHEALQSLGQLVAAVALRRSTDILITGSGMNMLSSVQYF